MENAGLKHHKLEGLTSKQFLYKKNLFIAILNPSTPYHSVEKMRMEAISLDVIKKRKLIIQLLTFPKRAEARLQFSNFTIMLTKRLILCKLQRNTK